MNSAVFPTPPGSGPQADDDSLWDLVYLVLPCPGVLASVSVFGVWFGGWTEFGFVVLTIVLLLLAFKRREGVRNRARYVELADRCAAWLAIAYTLLIAVTR